MPVKTASDWLKLALEKAEVKPEANQFYNPSQVEQMQQIAKTYFKTVCQIQTPDHYKRGTGCMIEGGLVITNHHVLNSIETAKKSHALFFRIEFQTADKSETITKTSRISLDPDRYFFTSSNNVKNGQIQKVDSGHLDFTIVALKLDDAFQIPDKIFSIFQENILPKEKTPISIIQHPDVIDSETNIKGDLKWAVGLIQKIEDYSMHYNAATAPGSSGGAVIDLQGKLIALHYQSFKCDCNSDGRCNSGVLISQIRNCLRNKENYKKESQEPIITKIMIEKVKEWNEKLEKLLFNDLKDFYCSQEKIETLVKERTISIEDIYVRLALIKDEKKNKEKQDKKVQTPEDGRWPTYETLYNPKESIKLEELFQHEKLKEKIEKRVIVWGAAGVGKSTCLHHIAHEWANRTTLE